MWEAEKQVKRSLETQGWKVLRNGWPDFLCVRGKEIQAVEVKNTGKLTFEQKEMIVALRSAGISVKIIELPLPKQYPHQKRKFSRSWVRYRPSSRVDLSLLQKELLITPKRTYKEIATTMGCSESLVKKSARKLGFRRNQSRRPTP